MLEAYINLEYSSDKKVQTDYALSKDNKNNFKTFGFISPHNFKEVKENKLPDLVKDSHEKEINITSKLNPKPRGCPMGRNRLIEIINFLSAQRPDITFKLAT